MDMLNTAAIESLRSFALDQRDGARLCSADRTHFSAFAHMCTAAIQGDPGRGVGGRADHPCTSLWYQLSDSAA